MRVSRLSGLVWLKSARSVGFSLRGGAGNDNLPIGGLQPANQEMGVPKRTIPSNTTIQNPNPI